MRSSKLILLAVGAAFTSSILWTSSQGQRTQKSTPQSQGSASSAAAPPHAPQDEWPLAAGDKAYGAIDGRHIWQYVKEQAALAEKYRDNGHPQFWGRVTGTSGDAEDAQWLLNKYRQIGMTDTHIQPIDLSTPQWYGQSWAVTVSGGGKTTTLTSAQPAWGSPGTEGKELDLEAVYVGLGSEADFAGRDVRGKAVLFVKSVPTYQAGPADILKRAEDKGAAAIFSTDLRGGNYKMQSYRAYTNVPTFDLGTEDGQAIRDLIAHDGSAGNPLHIKIRMDVQWVPNLKSSLVWGTLPGATDETIYVIAHRDGWFDAGGDNASGVASMLGLAEYFSKVPKAERRRTMIFIGTDGHHNVQPGGFGREWLVDHRAQFFTKTALMINDEHPSEVLTHGGIAGSTDTTVPLDWYAGGPSRPELTKIAADAFREFGVPVWSEPSKTPPSGDLGRFYWFLPGLVAQSNDFMFMHTEGDTPNNVPWTGLEAVTRAYAKIIDEVNRIDLKDLEQPAQPDPNPGRARPDANHPR